MAPNIRCSPVAPSLAERIGRAPCQLAAPTVMLSLLLLLLLLLLRSSTGRAVAKATWLIKLHSSCGT